MAPRDKDFNDEDYFYDDSEDYFFNKKRRSDKYKDKKYKRSRKNIDENFKDELDEEHDFNEIHEGKEYRDRFSDDFFSDADFNYTDEEDIPSGADPEEYLRRTRLVKQRRRKKKIITSSILIIFVVAIIAVGVFFGYKFIKNKISQGSTETADTITEPINIPSNLQLSEDISMVIAGASENLLEPDINFIFYLKFDSKNSKLTSLTIPINTLMDIPGFGLESVDKAAGSGGMDLLMLTLKKALGVNVDKYMLLDIKSIVDKLGGVSINLDSDITINNYENNEEIKLNSGENKIDGLTAVNYLKYYSGIEKDVLTNQTINQKKIFDAVILSIAGESDGELEKNLNSINKLYETNLSAEEVFQFFSTFSKLPKENNVVYPLDVTSVELEGGNIFYVPDISKLSEIFELQDTQTSSTVLNKVTADLQVLNGVGTPGIAGKVSELFRDLKYDDGTQKFNVLEAKDADNYNYKETEIVVNSSDPSYMALAEEIKTILKVGNIKKNEQASTQNIVIIVGSDFGKEQSTTETTQQVTEPVKVNVLNGVGIAGLAKKAKQQLEDNLNANGKIIDVIETKDADNFNYTQTQIILYKDTEEVNSVAQQIQKVLGVGLIKSSDENPENISISIILGKDYSAE